MDRCQEGYESPNQVLCCQCVVHVVKQDSPALPAEGQVTHHLPTCTTGRGQTCMLFQVEVEEDFGRRAAAGAAGASSLAQKRRKHRQPPSQRRRENRAPTFRECSVCLGCSAVPMGNPHTHPHTHRRRKHLILQMMKRKLRDAKQLAQGLSVICPWQGCNLNPILTALQAPFPPPMDTGKGYKLSQDRP